MAEGSGPRAHRSSLEDPEDNRHQLSEQVIGSVLTCRCGCWRRISLVSFGQPFFGPSLNAIAFVTAVCIFCNPGLVVPDGPMCMCLGAEGTPGKALKYTSNMPPVLAVMLAL
jgi:hypothetical protein